jgi:hypothetical protein
MDWINLAKVRTVLRFLAVRFLMPSYLELRSMDKVHKLINSEIGSRLIILVGVWFPAVMAPVDQVDRHFPLPHVAVEPSVSSVPVPVELVSVCCSQELQHVLTAG